MEQQTKLNQSYLALVEFLLLSKHRLIELGSQYDLSGMQIITLLLVSEPRPMNTFSKIFNCDPSNVTGIIDGLQQKKLVTRFESKEDRRIKMVKLLAKGQKLRDRILQAVSTSDDYLLAKLTPEEAATFIALVQKLTRDEAVPVCS